MFGVGKYKVGIALLFIVMLSMPVTLAQSAQDIYDINDRQTRDLKTYFDTKMSSTKDEVSKLVDNLFQTWDKRMNELTRNFTIQTTILLFFAVLLANTISILMRQSHERKLIEYRYNNLLNKEVELNRKLDKYNHELQQNQTRPNPSPTPQDLTNPQENTQPVAQSQATATARPVGEPQKAQPNIPPGYHPDPQPIPQIPAPEIPANPKRGPFGLFGSKPQLTEQEKADLKFKKEMAQALKGVA